MGEIFDLDLERHLLAGVLSHPKTFPDIDYLISDKDFKNKLHRTIWSVIKQSLRANESLDNIIIAQKINSYAISFEDKIDSVANYLDEITSLPPKEENVKPTAERLKTVSLRRMIAETGERISSEMHQHGELASEQLVSLSNSLYAHVINNFQNKNEPVDLFQGIPPLINSLTDDAPSREIVVPYSNYQKFFGGFFPGDLVVFASGSKQGKSLLLSDMVRKICDTQPNVKALIVDTELETEKIRTRTVAAMAGINEYLFKSKKWKEMPEVKEKIQKTLPLLEKYFNKVDHIYVGNISTDEMVSIVKRWHWKNVKENTKPLIIIDYFKLTDKDKITDAFASSMSLGYRVDTFKKLASELRCPILSACQTNRSNEVGLSHEISKFVSSLFWFSRKNPEEMARDNYNPLDPKNATHKLVPLYTRDLGEHVDGVNNLVKVPSSGGKSSYAQNYLNFKVENFVVDEMDDLRKSMENLETKKLDIRVKQKSVEL